MTSLMGWLYYFNIINVNSAATLAIDYKDLSNSSDIRTATRFRIGSIWILFVYLYSLYRLGAEVILSEKIKWFFLLIYTVIYLWFVVQTRTNMFSIGVCTLFYFVLFHRIFFRNNLIYVISLGFILLPVIIFNVDEFQEQYIKFLLLIDSAINSGFSVRDWTTSIILDELYNNYFIGMGALSLQYNGGFSTVYNEYFYLSDVGIYGLVYRFGFFGVFFIPLLYVYVAFLLYKSRYFYFSKIYFLCFLSHIILIKYSALATYGGAELALVFAILTYKCNSIYNREVR
jgi:hypothetical protein